MAIVLDASIAGCWAFDDEDHPVAVAARRRVLSAGARVPAVWWFEIRNVLLINERRGRIAEANIAAFLHDLSRLNIVIDRAPDDSALLNLGRRFRLSAYDAGYLELAQREGLPLATLDGALTRAARAAQISLVGEEPH